MIKTWLNSQTGIFCFFYSTDGRKWKLREKLQSFSLFTATLTSSSYRDNQFMVKMINVKNVIDRIDQVSVQRDWTWWRKEFTEETSTNSCWQTNLIGRSLQWCHSTTSLIGWLLWLDNCNNTLDISFLFGKSLIIKIIMMMIIKLFTVLASYILN